MIPENVTKDLQAAIAKFNAAAERTDSIETAVAELKARFMSITTERDPRLARTLGEWDSEDHAKKFVTYLRDLYNKDTVLLKALNETTDGAGGYLVPEEFVPTLIRLIYNYGWVRNNATMIPMNRDEKTFPTLTSGVTVVWPTPNRGELATINPSQPAFNVMKVNVQKMAVLVQASSEILEDSSIEMANLLGTLVAEAIAKEEDRVGLVGSVAGGDPYNGILYDPSVTQVVMASGDNSISNMTAEHLLDMQTAVATPALGAGCTYIMSRSVFDAVRKLKDGNNQYIFNPVGQGGGNGGSQGTQAAPGTIWGYPYVLSEVMPAYTASDVNGTPYIIFGNPKQLWMMDRRQLTAAVSQHVGFTTDSTYFRWTQRIGFKVAIGSALSVLATHPD